MSASKWKFSTKVIRNVLIITSMKFLAGHVLGPAENGS
jgi:hypothetical protein